MGETTTSKRTYTDEQRRAAKLQAEGATVDGGSGGGH